MPASCTALTVIGPASTPAGPSWDEQQSDASPGNRFANARGTFLHARNTNASSRVISFYADSYGAEIVVMTVTIPGSATENGERHLGPFPAAKFNDHSATEAASSGQVMLSHNGADADLMLTPILTNTQLLG